jgi:hypothetical protein
MFKPSRAGLPTLFRSDDLGRPPAVLRQKGLRAAPGAFPTAAALTAVRTWGSAAAAMLDIRPKATRNEMLCIFMALVELSKGNEAGGMAYRAIIVDPVLENHIWTDAEEGGPGQRSRSWPSHRPGRA